MALLLSLLRRRLHEGNPGAFYQPNTRLKKPGVSLSSATFQRLHIYWRCSSESCILVSSISASSVSALILRGFSTKLLFNLPPFSDCQGFVQLQIPIAFLAGMLLVGTHLSLTDLFLSVFTLIPALLTSPNFFSTSFSFALSVLTSGPLFLNVVSPAKQPTCTTGSSIQCLSPYSWLKSFPVSYGSPSHNQCAEGCCQKSCFRARTHHDQDEKYTDKNMTIANATRDSLEVCIGVVALSNGYTQAHRLPEA